MQAHSGVNQQKLAAIKPQRCHLRTTLGVSRFGGSARRFQRRNLITQMAAAPDLVADAPDLTGEEKKSPKFVPDLMNRTYYPKKIDTTRVEKQWYIIDAEGQTLGRLACLAANHIRGKLSAAYSPSMDMGDYIIVINAEKVAVTGNKFSKKKYFRHTNGRPGKYKIEAFKDLQKRIPERIVEKAVKGMLPKGRLGRSLFHHLKVYKGVSHPHVAQQPIDITHMIDQKPKVLVKKAEASA